MKPQFDDHDLQGIEECTRGEARCFQFDRPEKYPTSLLKRVNQLCAKHGDKVHVRFYGHVMRPFTAAVVRQLRDVVSLSIEVSTADDLHAIWDLPALKHLGLHITNMNEPDLLGGSNLLQLVTLDIGQAGKRPLDLAPIAGMKHLKTLSLTQPVRNVEELAGLPRVQSLTVRTVQRTAPLAWIATLPKLRSLVIASGTRENLDDVSHSKLSTFRLQLVRQLTRFDLAAFPDIKEFIVHNQAQLTRLVCSKRNDKLKLIQLLACPKLKSFKGVRELPALKSFAAVKCGASEEALMSA